MTQADTPMPGEDPGALIEDPPREDDLDPPNEDGTGGDPPPLADETPGADDAPRQRT